MNHRRLYEIDLFRFLSAVAVVLFHYTYNFRHIAPVDMMAFPYFSWAPVTKYGYLGVHLFFMISGFVILMSASQGSARSFIASRVVRLFPAFWVCCTATFLVTRAIDGGAHAATLEQYLVNMTMLSGFAHVPYMDGAYWSLGIELQFYLLVFMVLLCGQLQRLETLLGLWLIVVLVSLVWPIKYLSGLLVTDYASFFIAGAALYLIFRDGPSLYRGCLLTGAYLAVQLYALEYTVKMRGWHNDTFSDAIVGTVETSFFLLLLMVALGHTQWLASRRWLVIGALTYPLYLVHQQIGHTLFNVMHAHVNAHLLMWGVVALVISIAFLVHRQVEQRYAASFRAWIDSAVEALETRLRTWWDARSRSGSA